MLGGRAGLGVDHDLLLVVLGRGILHLGAGGLTEIFEHGLDELLVVAAPGAEDGERLALEVDLLQFVEIGPVEARVLARLELQLSHGRCGDCKGQGSDAECQTEFHQCSSHDECRVLKGCRAFRSRSRIQSALNSSLHRSECRLGSSKTAAMVAEIPHILLRCSMRMQLFHRCQFTHLAGNSFESALRNMADVQHHEFARTVRPAWPVPDDGQPGPQRLSGSLGGNPCPGARCRRTSWLPAERRGAAAGHRTVRHARSRLPGRAQHAGRSAVHRIPPRLRRARPPNSATTSRWPWRMARRRKRAVYRRAVRNARVDAMILSSPLFEDPRPALLRQLEDALHRAWPHRAALALRLRRHRQ